MKPINKIAVAALFALTGAGMANAATTVVRVTGSTAYRVADVTAETNYLNSIAGTGGVTAEFFGSSLTGANISVIYGPIPSGGGNQTVFENLFNGSVGGAEALTGPIAESFPLASSYSGTATAVTTIGSSTTAASGGHPSADGSTPTHVDSHAPDIAFSDVFLDSAQQIFALSTVTPTLNPLQKTVGVVPFVFIAGKGSPSTLANVTPQIFNYLYSAGSVPLELFSGNTADKTISVFALGRDIDSGTRATAFAETGFGITTPPTQNYAYDTVPHANANDDKIGVVGNDSAATTIGAFNTTPAKTLDGVFMDVGQGGYNSGGNLATAMKATNTVLSTSLAICYLGVSDATSALGGSALLMSYNGVKYDPTSTAAANQGLIENGQYTFWGYEHEFYFSASSAVATSLATQLNSGIDKLSAAGITFNAMTVSRQDDGTNVQY